MCILQARLSAKAPYVPDSNSYINYLGAGYSLPYGNPRDPAGIVDPGFRASIIALTYDKGRFSSDAWYALPDHADVTAEPGSSFSSTATSISSEESYKQQLDQSVSSTTEAGFTKFFQSRFSYSASYEATVEGFVSTSSTLIDLIGETVSYRARLVNTTYNSKNEKRVLNAFWTASQRISNASPERLLKAFLTAFEMRLRCVCGNAF